MNRIKNKLLFLICLLVFTIGAGAVFCVPKIDGNIEAASTSKGNFDPYAQAWLDGEYAWYDDAMGIQPYIEYLNKFNSNEEVIVVVIDSGICTINPLFKDRILTAKETKTYNLGYKDPKTGAFVQVDEVSYTKGDLLGYSMLGSRVTGGRFVSSVDYSKFPYSTNPNIPSDYKPYPFEDDKDTGHGTAVASIIASLTPKNVKILPIKKANAEEPKGYIRYVDYFYGTFELIKVLKEDGYNIVAVNMSYNMGFNGPTWTDVALNEVWSVDETFNRHVNILRDDYNILTCIASGNDQYDTTTMLMASCESPIVCGMVEKLDNGQYLRVENKISSSGLLSGSGYGETLDIVAPGWQVKVATFKGTEEFLKDATFTEYRIANGTSFATPCVSALVALLACDENYYDTEGKPIEGLPDKIEERLKSSARDMVAYNDEKGFDIYYGYGLANLANHQIEINYETEDVELTYDGKYHNIEVTPYVDCDIYYSLEEDGEYNITNITKVDAFKNATHGKKPIYFKLQIKDDVNNYYFKETKGVAYLTINPIELDAVTLIDQTIAYGGLDELDHTQYKITNGAVLPGDEGDLCMDSNATNKSGVGEYELFVASRSGNYKVNSNKKKLTIVKRNVTIQLGTTSSEYGSDVNLDKYTYNVIKGEVKNEEFLKLNLTTNADSTSVVGAYELNGINLDDNYNVTILKGEHIVMPKEIVIRVKDSTTWFLSVLDYSTVEWEILSGEIQEGDDLNIEIFSNVNSKKLGKYESWAISHNPNYEIIVQKGIVNVKLSDTQLLFLIVIGILIFVAIIVGVTIMVRVKTRKRRLKKAAKYERQSFMIG